MAFESLLSCLNCFHHLKCLVNNNNRKKTCRTIVKQYFQLVIIVIYNTKQLISSEIWQAPTMTIFKNVCLSCLNFLQKQNTLSIFVRMKVHIDAVRTDHWVSWFWSIFAFRIYLLHPQSHCFRFNCFPPFSVSSVSASYSVYKVTTLILKSVIT